MLRRVWSALSSGSPFAAGPSARNSTTADLCLAPGRPPCPGPAEVTGIYQDGKGPYLSQEGVEFAVNGDLRITPLCSANRSFDALLPAAALARLTGPMETCRGTGALLKIPALINAQTGVVGEPSLPPDYPKGASVFYYFLVDRTGHGKFSLSDDDAYYFVWQSGIHLNRTEQDDQTVFELTTELTSPDAELIREADTGGESEGVFPVPLALTVTRLK
jgi:hypothetical protein